LGLTKRKKKITHFDGQAPFFPEMKRRDLLIGRKGPGALINKKSINKNGKRY
jgi:hypothetical protein